VIRSRKRGHQDPGHQQYSWKLTTGTVSAQKTAEEQDKDNKVLAGQG